MTDNEALNELLSLMPETLQKQLKAHYESLRQRKSISEAYEETNYLKEKSKKKYGL